MCEALCGLHNFCVNARVKPEGTERTPSSARFDPEELDTPFTDRVAIEMLIGVNTQKGGAPQDLLHGRDHFDDVPDTNV